MGEPLYNPNDRLTGRDGGPYLDIVQAQADEVIRAKREGREPDLENPPANAGIPLSTAAQLLRTVDVNQPSAFHETHDTARLMFEAADKSDKSLMHKMDERPDQKEIDKAVAKAKRAEESAKDEDKETDVTGVASAAAAKNTSDASTGSKNTTTTK